MIIVLRNDFNFQILCATDTESEENFTIKYLTKNTNLVFSKRRSTFDNYKKLDEASLNIFIDSAMGYESLARRKQNSCSQLFRLFKEERLI